MNSYICNYDNVDISHGHKTLICITWCHVIKTTYVLYTKGSCAILPKWTQKDYPNYLKVNFAMWSWIFFFKSRRCYSFVEFCCTFLLCCLKCWSNSNMSMNSSLTRFFCLHDHCLMLLNDLASLFVFIVVILLKSSNISSSDREWFKWCHCNIATWRSSYEKAGNSFFFWFAFYVRH